MTKVSKPIAGVKHIRNGFTIRTKEDLDNSRCKAYNLNIR